MSCSKPVSMPITDRFGVQHYPSDISGKPIAFPCGYCVGCKTDKINLWTQRLTYEYTGKTSSFVTLTYDDTHLYYNTGFYEPSLNRKGLTQFINSLRHYIARHHFVSRDVDPNFKFFAVGEYGSDKLRPHFHLLLMGLSPQWCSVELPKLWKNGSVRVDPMMLGSVRYVLKYMEKQQNKDYYKKHYICFGLEPPFISCSPGIGSEYIMAHASQIRSTGYIRDGTKNIPVPNYWKNKIFLEAPSKRFIDAQIDFKKNINKEHFSFAKSHGYRDYDAYMLEQARIKEQEMVHDMRRQGIPIDDYRNYGHQSYKVPKYFSLVERNRKLHTMAYDALDRNGE